ncbi:MAG: AbrB/MazE/SpoVT family DNA-binding domain-containing protein [Clostridia bacterium]|nr:AbrB/MazE/SpoVT family DNA-binding domain-containing protein [Clostridia bacterium]
MKKGYVGICKVGEKGQIVIPKEARDMFSINPGDNLVVLCDINKGMAIVKSEIFDDVTNKVLGGNKND